ncbi:MAG: acylphosphatase [Opitutae bacterium]|jgi:acylphosphatase|nr:acylphosphatase [Opitutae bacterium]MBT4224532.1 acylphosphatase [Opitutae bacterium]MBT5689968.1 acylphosphatase [Opitutae bacterium]MBT6461547.1 acylphosphatase [Opitutae bacterium]MBT7852933.1 acylphosphatase [Opitutae bacterium]
MSKMVEDVFQLTVRFSGQVQGVYFRATTEQISKEFSVTGRVKNLPDGRVWLFAEGEQSEVESFFSQIVEVRGRHITEMEKEESFGARQFQDFSIGY